MEWNNYDEQENTKKSMSTSSKILLAIIVCVLLMIILIVILLMNMQKMSKYIISVDRVNVNTSTKETLLTKVEDETYINIEEFAKLVGYEYHAGEYKGYITEEDKCHVEGKDEIASFYQDDNKVYKLPKNEKQKQYEEYTVEDSIKNIKGKMYAPKEAILKAFNVAIEENENSFNVFTLDYLVKGYDAKVIKWGYESIVNHTFENKKALLYGCLIVKKGNELYKIIDLQNTEIVLPRYTEIKFNENVKSFFVTNSSNQIGIMNINGTTELEPNYESVEILDKKYNLYKIKQNGKYGVVKGGDVTVIFPEYDSIGMEMGSNKLMLDTLIPVYKNEKWGAYDKQGNLILKIEYQGFGCELTSVEINGIKESVIPVTEIEIAKGIVVKKDDKYGLMSLNGEELVPIAVDSIYARDNENEETKYFMIYNGNKLNVIERLIKADKMPEEYKKEETTSTNDTTNNIQNGNVTQNITNETNNSNIDNVSYSNATETVQ